LRQLLLLLLHLFGCIGFCCCIRCCLLYWFDLTVHFVLPDRLLPLLLH
jgi:hypothetical protein